jgi:hypothetical protein
VRCRREGQEERRRLLGGLIVLALAGCPGPIARPYPAPPGPDLVAHVRDRAKVVPVLKAETRTDVRVGKDRANVSVLIWAEQSGKLRFQAMNPNDSLAADLASDGQTFCFLDTHANCGSCGKATPDNVARLIRIPLEPDEVVAVLVGGAPVLPDDTPEVTWDEKNGREILSLEAEGWKQKVVLDGRDKRWDLLEAEMLEPNGKLFWRVRHKDFHEVAGPGGAKVRLPGASLFEQGDQKVRIEWKVQAADQTPPEKAFQMDLPPGLADCGSPEK